MNSFSFSWLIKQQGTHDIKVTSKADTTEIKIIFSDYIVNELHVEENLFVYIEWSAVKHVNSAFLSEKMSQKKKEKGKKVCMEWYIKFRSIAKIFYLEALCTAVCRFLHNPVTPLNTKNTKCFSWASKF